MKCGPITDPPGPGECKLRIRSNGDPIDTYVYAVDEHGVEREVVCVTAVSWAMADRGELPRATIEVEGAEVVLDAPVVELVPANGSVL